MRVQIPPAQFNISNYPGCNMLYITKKDQDKLKEIFCGWTVVDVRFLSLDEFVGEFVLQKDGQTKTIRLFANDLGFWTVENAD
ncbi:MAG: hypothetical protein HC888_03385 [Candidatus Competibacteraceae bacterium]|nr:hypothetical protein [Candidatus Competibacteraceae bacterium]